MSFKSARAQIEFNPFKLVFLIVLASIFFQTIRRSNFKISPNIEGEIDKLAADGKGLEEGAKFGPTPEPARGFFGLIGFAEAGKKKKKEKSEVVVISVNNPGGGHKGGGMYPIFIPSCGGGHGGGHGGYGRKRR